MSLDKACLGEFEDLSHPKTLLAHKVNEFKDLNGSALACLFSHKLFIFLDLFNTLLLQGLFGFGLDKGEVEFFVGYLPWDLLLKVVDQETD